jgi:tetrahydroxynaphthalene reductase
VISNSGVEAFDHISTLTPEEFNRVFAINPRAQLLVAQQAYKYLTPGGRLIMLSSISASAKNIGNHALYSGFKAAVEAVGRCLAVDMKDKKIRVNCIAPGGIKTDMYAEHARKYIPGSEGWSGEKVEEVASSFGLLGRMGLPSDVIAWLPSCVAKTELG